MKKDALAVANYILTLAQEQGDSITLLGLVKRVYLAHGFALAFYDDGVLNSCFDHVEAWRCGPIIPSVYNHFNFDCDNIVHDKAIEVRMDEQGVITTPEFLLTDERARKVVRWVYTRYRGKSDEELVGLLNHKGTPWAYCREEGRNNEIPDRITRAFYVQVMDDIMSSSANDKSKVLDTPVVAEECNLNHELYLNAFRDEKIKDIQQDREERKKYACNLFWLVLWYLVFVIALLYFCGFGFTKLETNVLVTLLATTTATVLGLFVIVARYLFK